MIQVDLVSHGIVSLVRDQHGRFLLLEDGRDEMNGRWAPPHGRCEATDVDEKAGVIRETEEETGLIVRPVRVLLTQPADTKVKTVSFWLVDYIGGEMQIDSSESSDYGWFTLQEALAMNLYPGTQIFFEKIASGEIEI